MLNAPRTRLPDSMTQAQIKPVLLKGERKYQFAYHQDRKVTHRNLTGAEAQAELAALLTTQFRQGVFHTTQGETHVLLNKRQEVTIREVKRKEERPLVDRREGEVREGGKEELRFPLPLSSPSPPPSLTHDRPKNHILPEGEPIGFLVGLGVMSADGRVIAARRDKFRQINRFLEMAGDVVAPLVERAAQRPERPLRVVDFGCGKAYLTFALYHYLRHIRGLNITIVGVDLKQDVLAQCGALANQLGYEGLTFAAGDIQSYQSPEPADMAVALHACDTATDDALARAVAWNAQVILAAPCCQHELRSKIRNEALKPMLQYGIVRERLSALVTDTLRAELLGVYGYEVQMLEFVEAEHTPKNILIRAVKRPAAPANKPDTDKKNAAQEIYARFRDFWHVQPYMEQALASAMSNTSGSETNNE